MEVKDIIKSYLIANGFDGLCNMDCGCEISDLVPCGESFEYCEPGYKKIIDESGDYVIMKRKPKKRIILATKWDEDKYMNTVTAQQLNELAKEIHALAVEKGWWDTERSRGEVYALIHSEISEAVEEARKDRPAIYYINMNQQPMAWDRLLYTNIVLGRQVKPYGELIELADAVMRCLDWIGKTEKFFLKNHRHPVGYFDGMNPLEAYCMLHETISEGDIHGTIILSFTYAEHRGWDLLGAIRIKHEYNKTRPVRYGGKKY